MEIKLRNYTENDAEAIVAIINHVILNSTALYDYNPRNVALQIEIFDEKLKKGFPIIVATLNEKVVGFGYYSEFRFRDAYRFTVEHSVYVDHNFHGKGIGKLIMNELILLAKQQKLHTMIGVIDAENESSIAFHEQFGFKKVATLKETGYKFDRWLHSVLMQKFLE